MYTMEVDQPKGAAVKDSSVALHPLALVHMSDQYTRISTGGSPLDKSAAVVGLMYGFTDDQGVLQIQDADDIPPEASEQTQLQVDLHKAVFPLHSVVGWYRVTLKDEEPTPNDLQTTQRLSEHFASSSSQFCFCLLEVQQDTKETAGGSLNEVLPINLYTLREVEHQSILLGFDNWNLETSDPERIAVERVMKERPMQAEGSRASNSYVESSKSIQTSLDSMKDRINVLISFLRSTQEGKVPLNHRLLRQVQVLVHSLGPIAQIAGSEAPSEASDADIMAHLAAVAKTVSAVQSYTEKFRLVHENRNLNKEMRRAF
mmetsp:Transcript_36732/g.89122  ORF Transcript_36732/g.89122 Transcript_36732/m.89122 type:complete len:316 (-) Transcript_36732:646-1593(-)